MGNEFCGCCSEAVWDVIALAQAFVVGTCNAVVFAEAFGDAVASAIAPASASFSSWSVLGKGLLRLHLLVRLWWLRRSLFSSFSVLRIFFLSDLQLHSLWCYAVRARFCRWRHRCTYCHSVCLYISTSQILFGVRVSE
jgi:hypothetical protein